MASSGVRVGGLGPSEVGYLSPLKKDGNIIAAKISVYSDEDDEYFRLSHQKPFAVSH
jgi:hypothetical protein